LIIIGDNLFEDKDWKDYLDDESKAILAEIFDKSKKHQLAYLEAEDVKVAQLWTAILELSRDIKKMKDAVNVLKEPFKAIVAIGEAEKRRTIERIVRDMLKPEMEQEEATQKLVDSLMKF